MRVCNSFNTIIWKILVKFIVVIVIKQGSETPGPYSYNTSDQFIKPKRFSNISIGYDIKSTLKLIKQSPGPGQYNTENLTRMSSKYMNNNKPTLSVAKIIEKAMENP